MQYRAISLPRKCENLTNASAYDLFVGDQEGPIYRMRFIIRDGMEKTVSIEPYEHLDKLVVDLMPVARRWDLFTKQKGNDGVHEFSPEESQELLYFAHRVNIIQLSAGLADPKLMSSKKTAEEMLVKSNSV